MIRMILGLRSELSYHDIFGFAGVSSERPVEFIWHDRHRCPEKFIGRWGLQSGSVQWQRQSV